VIQPKLLQDRCRTLAVMARGSQHLAILQKHPRLSPAIES
jgi:hypothetical protein